MSDSRQSPVSTVISRTLFLVVCQVCGLLYTVFAHLIKDLDLFKQFGTFRVRVTGPGGVDLSNRCNSVTSQNLMHLSWVTLGGKDRIHHNSRPILHTFILMATTHFLQVSYTPISKIKCEDAARIFFNKSNILASLHFGSQKLFVIKTIPLQGKSPTKCQAGDQSEEFHFILLNNLLLILSTQQWPGGGPTLSPH